MVKFRKLKQYVVLWAGLGLLLSSLGSCRPAPTPELDFWTMQLQPQFTEYFKGAIATFEQQNPGSMVNWTDVPWEAMESKILTAVSAKTAPDVVNLNPSFASQLAGRKAWLDLNQAIPAETRSQYLPNIWQASTLDGMSFGIPWYLTTAVTIYNRDLLKAAGIETPPQTYAELADVAQKIKDKTGKSAFFVTFVPGDSGEVLESLVQMGVQLVDSQGKAAFNSPEGKAAFQYWVDLYQKGLLPPEVLTQGHRHAIDLYQSGETAILSSSAEFFKNIANNAPTIAQVSAAAPQITGKTGKRKVAVMNIVIPKDSDKPEEAVKFALFITNTENQLAFAKAANVLPSTIAAVEQFSQFLAQKSDATPMEQALKISADQLQTAEVLVPAIKNLSQLQKLIYENLQAAMLKQKTVEQALQDAATAWNQLTP